ncbi:hypothetical protein [Variovorax sp. PAMC26660]|uniref:hypothetical protein n=1 Tax=Variovorax sp. PAMC26660 TaxID=2762322 RepID=UPI0021C29742|nr:hypothetical protein [Variovorax sp. PAMC26660]
MNMTYDWIGSPSDMKRDGAAILEMLDASVRDDGMLGYSTRLSREEADAFLAFWEWQLQNKAASILLARDEAGVCAMTFMRINQNRNYMHIADLSKGYITPRMRGTALLSNLLLKICEKAKTLNIELLTLDTRENSRAFKVWTHFGFKSHGVLQDYSRSGGRSHVGHFMNQRVEDLGKNCQKGEKLVLQNKSDFRAKLENTLHQEIAKNILYSLFS